MALLLRIFGSGSLAGRVAVGILLLAGAVPFDEPPPKQAAPTASASKLNPMIGRTRSSLKRASEERGETAGIVSEWEPVSQSARQHVSTSGRRLTQSEVQPAINAPVLAARLSG